MRCSSIAYGAVAVACLACVDATAPNREVLPSGPVRAVAAAVDPNYPNEPAGLTLVSERPFNAKATTTTDVAGAEGWSPSEASYASLTIVSDNTAPKSPANVAQILFPSGFVGGSAPAVAAKSIGAPYRRLYVSVWLQLSATWQGPQYNAVNRIFSLWAGGKQRIAFMARGRGTGTLVPAVQLLQTADSRTRLDPNLLTSATVARGTWQRWEMVVTMNTPGTADGEVHWWVDGTKIAEYRNVQFVGASEADVWSQLRWNPVWGSSSDKVPSAMTMRWDHIFISGSESRTDSNPPPPDDSTGTSSTAIFSEGFESGSLAQWQDGVDPTKQRVITDASLAHSGTHVLEAGGGWWLADPVLHAGVRLGVRERVVRTC
jgi:hypothetical protein